MRWAPVVLLLVLPLAGCLGGGSDDGPTDTTGQDPTAAAAALNVTLTASQNAGFAPLAVNLSLDADVGENASVLWRIDVFLLEDLAQNATADTNGTADGNATTDDNGTAPTTLEPLQSFTGEALPATVNLTLDVGNYTVEARVDAGADGNGTASTSLLVEEEPAIVLPVLFVDGAENGTDQWTITSTIYVEDNLDPATPDAELPVPHLTKWEIVGDEIHTGAGSWFSGYHDDYRTTMVSIPLSVPDDGVKHILSYYVKGGAESNNVDGLWVSYGPEGGEMKNVAYHTGDITDWTPVRVPIASGDQVLEFRFDSDISCSPDTPLPAGCGEGTFLGFWVDDIEVR